jgi:ABC-type amino acid transport substrate-binding protein
MKGNITLGRTFALSSILVAAGVIAASAQSPTTEKERADQALYAGLPDAIKTRGVIKVGAAFESLPQINANPDDARKPIGIAPDLAALLAPIMGVKIEWVNTAWPGQIPGVRAGSLDALMGQISVTAEREKTLFDFVPYFKASNGILVLSGNPSGIQADVSSLCGLKIGAPLGSLYGRTLDGISKKYCPATAKGPIQLAEFQTAAAGSTAVLSGQVQGYYDGSETVKGVARTSAGKLSSVGLNYDQTKEWDAGLYGIAVTKENSGLTRAFLGAMQKIAADGSYTKVLEKYGTSDSGLKVTDIVVNPITKTPVGSTQASN